VLVALVLMTLAVFVTVMVLDTVRGEMIRAV